MLRRVRDVIIVYLCGYVSASIEAEYWYLCGIFTVIAFMVGCSHADGAEKWQRS